MAEAVIRIIVAEEKSAQTVRVTPTPAQKTVPVVQQPIPAPAPASTTGATTAPAGRQQSTFERALGGAARLAGGVGRALGIYSRGGSVGHYQSGGQVGALPAWLGTPTPLVPPPPPGWQPQFMKMAPAQAQRAAANAAIGQGQPPNVAAQLGAAVAKYVDQYSTYGPNVYQRVLSNVYGRTDDLEHAMAVARGAAQRADQLAGRRAVGGNVTENRAESGVPGQPRGTDQIPAWLTKGEFVVNAQAAQQHRGLLEAINKQQGGAVYRQQGGPAYMQGGGIQAGLHVAGMLGVPGAAAAAGPAGVAVAIGSAIQSAGHIVATEISRAITSPLSTVAHQGTDPSALVGGAGQIAANAGQHASMLLDVFTGGIPVVSSFVVATGEAVAGLGRFMHELDKTSKHYAQYNPQLAMAEAQGDVRQIVGDLRRAQVIGPNLSKYVEARTDVTQKVEDLKATLLRELIPLATQILQGITTGLDYISKSAEFLATVAEWAGDKKAKQLLQEIANNTKKQPGDDLTLTEATKLIYEGYGGAGVQVPGREFGR